MGMGIKKKELERIMMDYVRWLFRLDFCTPQYIIQRELGLIKLKCEWEIRTMNYDQKVREKEERYYVQKC